MVPEYMFVLKIQVKNSVTNLYCLHVYLYPEGRIIHYKHEESQLKR